MSSLPPPSVVPLGDTAAIIQLGDQINRETFPRIRALADYLDLHPLRGMTEYVPAFTTLAVYYDPLVVSFHDIAAQLAGARPKVSRQIISIHKPSKSPSATAASLVRIWIMDSCWCPR